MKHIKIHEEYSDDEIRDLIGDLEKIGFKHRLIPGQDFGFGPDLKGKNDGKNILFLTSETIEYISKSNLTYRSDGMELSWPIWSEYKKSHDEKMPIPRILKSEDIKSIEYPPTMAGFVGNPHDRPIKGLYFVHLYSTRTGRSFPVSIFGSRSSFISSKKVAPIYDIVVKKLKSLNI